MHGHPPLSLLSRLPSAVAHAARRTARRGLQVARRSPAWAIIEGSRQAGATRRVAAAERRTWRLARRIRRRTGQHAAAEWRAASGHGAGRDICRPARSVDMPLARSLRARAISTTISSAPTCRILKRGAYRAALEYAAMRPRTPRRRGAGSGPGGGCSGGWAFVARCSGA